MTQKIIDKSVFQLKSTVYGPVKSWRFGMSLGIDPLFYTSTCSFNCIYCQLGHIQNITTEIKEYVSTVKVLSDFKERLKTSEPLDIIMFSGSGEPTLAKNLGEMIIGIKEILPKVEIAILTNAVHLNEPIVQKNLRNIDRVIVKLDAPNDKILKRINRPAEGVSFKSILSGIKAFAQSYKGALEVQMMFMPLNKNEVDELAKHLKEISPKVVQLNTPKRPYPIGWYRENRGNHIGLHDHETQELKTVTIEEAQNLKESLEAKTGLEILSVYR